jgi:hypothetical protein
MTLLMQTANLATAKDCSLSREFRIKKAQILKGILQDPAGALMPQIEMELLCGKKVVRHLTTNNQGAYDFGEIPTGRYRIHIVSREGVLCAPKVRCGKKGCVVDSKISISSKAVILFQ